LFVLDAPHRKIHFAMRNGVFSRSEKQREDIPIVLAACLDCVLHGPPVTVDDGFQAEQIEYRRRKINAVDKRFAAGPRRDMTGPIHDAGRLCAVR
jgi:hypothetical protein